MKINPKYSYTKNYVLPQGAFRVVSQSIRDMELLLFSEKYIITLILQNKLK